MHPKLMEILTVVSLLAVGGYGWSQDTKSTNPKGQDTKDPEVFESTRHDKLVLKDQVYGEDKKDIVLFAKHAVVAEGANVKILNGIRFVLDTELLEVEGKGTLDGTGTKGGSGSKGRDGGYWDNRGTGCNHKHWEEAGRHPNDVGHPGGAGLKGGVGATIRIFHEKLKGKADAIKIVVDGGEGGDGGAGGDGRLLHCCHCQNNKRGPSGPAGPAGPQGDRGSFDVIPRSDLSISVVNR